jgi:hypothetical protein
MKINKQIFARSGRKFLAGFSLVEATIGMALVGTTIGALYAGFTTGFFTMRMTRDNLRVTQIMLDKMETIRLYNWDQINTPGFIPTSFTAKYDPDAPEGQQGHTYQGTVVITNAPLGTSYADDMKLVTVTLNWKTGDLNRTRQFSSYISRCGLQDYIY